MFKHFPLLAKKLFFFFFFLPSLQYRKCFLRIPQLQAIPEQEQSVNVESWRRSLGQTSSLDV